MFVGIVTGTVVSTRKIEKLVGSKFMIVQHIENNKPVNKFTVAVDTVGAGEGERVIVATGSAARLVLDYANSPVDASIVGIVDNISQ